MRSRSVLRVSGAVTWVPAAVWLFVVVSKAVNGFRESTALGISFLCVGAGVVVAIFAGVLTYMNLAKAPARKYARKVNRWALTGVNAPDAGVRELLNTAPGALPYHWIVTADPQAIELRTNNKKALPILVIQRDQISAVSLGALAGGGFVHRSLNLEIRGASFPLKLAVLKDSRLGIGTDSRKALEIKALCLGLELVDRPS